MQASLSRVGIDPTAALDRARSQSRGRKRTRSQAPDDVDMAEAEEPKRIHSSKSRSALPVSHPLVTCLVCCASCHLSCKKPLFVHSWSAGSGTSRKVEVTSMLHLYVTQLQRTLFAAL